MGDVILGMCGGYTASHIEAFLLTCRRHYSGRIVFFVKDCSDDTKALFHSHDVEAIQADDCEFPVVDRFQYFREFIRRDERTERCLITDTRDVVFQGDPFALPGEENELKFYSEAALHSECKASRKWVEELYGLDVLHPLLDKPVLNGGTILASRKGALDFLVRLTGEIERLGVRRFGTDQAALNYLYYFGALPGAQSFRHGYGEVQTLHHQKAFTFDKNGVLLNCDGTKPAVIHQYDRHAFLIRHFNVEHFDRLNKAELQKFRRIGRSRSAALKHLVNMMMSKGLNGRERDAAAPSSPRR
jgi:hypothetical protein